MCMVQSRSKIVRRLTLAQRDRSLVMVRRKFQDDDETPGFAIAVLDDWVAIHELANGPHLDVVVLLRLDLVTKVEAMWGQDYLTRGVAGLGKPIAEFECAPDATAADLLRVVDARSEFACVYLETREDYWLALGKILRIGDKRLDLHYVGRDGVWVDFVERWKLKDITRIEFGGRYIQALEQFSESIPAVSKRVKR